MKGVASAPCRRLRAASLLPSWHLLVHTTSEHRLTLSLSWGAMTHPIESAQVFFLSFVLCLAIRSPRCRHATQLPVPVLRQTLHSQADNVPANRAAYHLCVVQCLGVCDGHGGQLLIVTIACVHSPCCTFYSCSDMTVAC